MPKNYSTSGGLLLNENNKYLANLNIEGKPNILYLKFIRNNSKEMDLNKSTVYVLELNLNKTMAGFSEAIKIRTLTSKNEHAIIRD